MFGDVVRGSTACSSRRRSAREVRARGLARHRADGRRPAALVAEFKRIFGAETGEDFPREPREQLLRAVAAVFGSWNGARAIEYRRLNGIPDDWGTAVNVQQMVFGNKGEALAPASPSAAMRSTGRRGRPATSCSTPRARTSSRARATPTISTRWRGVLPDAHAQLIEIVGTLERHFRDMQDVEFTVEEGTLYMLQARSAKRPPHAAVRVAVDMVAEGILEREEALAKIDAGKLEALLHPSFDPELRFELLARGVPASPGSPRAASSSPPSGRSSAPPRART